MEAVGDPACFLAEWYLPELTEQAVDNIVARLAAAVCEEGIPVRLRAAELHKKDRQQRRLSRRRGTGGRRTPYASMELRVTAGPTGIPRPVVVETTTFTVPVFGFGIGPRGPGTPGDLGHLIRRRNRGVEVQEAALNLLDQVVATHLVSVANR